MHITDKNKELLQVSKKKGGKAVPKENIRLLCRQTWRIRWKPKRLGNKSYKLLLLIFTLIYKITFPKSVLHKNLKFHFKILFNYMVRVILANDSFKTICMVPRCRKSLSILVKNSKKSGKREEKFKLFDGFWLTSVLFELGQV